MSIVFHLNPFQRHQREHAEWFRDGFAKHGLDLTVTDRLTETADIHIISGPHYAYRHWVGYPNVLMIDRAYCHEETSGQWQSMDWISLGWLNRDGSRSFVKGEGRTLPNCIQSTGKKTIFLADYGQDKPSHIQADIVRYHPDDRPSETTLEYDLIRSGKAIGYHTSALVKAALMGLEVECLDETSILNQPDWRELLPYADWHYSEIQSGEAWANLQL